MLYRDKLGSDAAAIRRMCLKFDIYWHPDCFAMVSKTNPNTSKIRSYMRFTNLIHFVGKTYDTTMEEEEALNNAYIVQQQAEAKEAKEAKIEEEFRKKHEPPPQTMPMPEPEVIAFWGPGFMPEFYADLEARYKKWTKDLQKPLPVAEEALYKQICIQEASINRNVLMGRSIESGQKALNELLGSLNAKPVQKSNDTTSEDNTPFGVWVRRFENEKPIPEPDPELKDVDGIIRYISIWLLGHLCKMLGIKNTYCKLYEDEIARLRVDRPEYEDEDDETVFNDIFG